MTHQPCCTCAVSHKGNKDVKARCMAKARQLLQKVRRTAYDASTLLHLCGKP